MSEIDAGKPNSKHCRSSVLPSCFTCFRADGDGEKSPGIIESSDRRRRKSRWIFLFKFRTKKSATKTVPLDNLSTEQRNQRKNVEKDGKVLKSSEFMTEKRRIPVTIDEKAVTVQPVLAFLSDRQKVPAGKYPKAKYETVQKTILESHDQQDPFHSMKDDPINKKKSLQKQRSELPQTTNLSEDSPLANNFMIRQSSFPLDPARTKPAHSTGRTFRKGSSRKGDELAGEFKPVIGISVLIVVLAILLLWGKLCAILCTSAWFYFIPSFRRIVKFTETSGENYGLDDSGKINLDSDEYKKKVILEGLLERKRRKHTG